MDKHTAAAKLWLDRRYRRDAEGCYVAHQPIDGLHTARSEPNSLLRLARTYRILEWLAGLHFRTALDVGGGEGYLAAVIRDLFDATTVHSTDLSAEACQRAGEIFDVCAITADGASLPFADGAYDVVVCSEVIEHLSRPALAIGELVRVARRFVVISTAEFCPSGELERRLRSYTLDRSYPHAEMNWFTAGDFTALLGTRLAMSSQFRNVAHLVHERSWSREEAERLLTYLTGSTALDVDHAGVIVVCAKPGEDVPVGARANDVDRRRILDRLLEPARRPASAFSASGLALDDDVAARLRCVRCRARVAPRGAGSLGCRACGASYAVTGGVPVMIAVDPDEGSDGPREAACVATLAAGDPDRERAVHAAMAYLHRSDRAPHRTITRSVAGQLLRLVWLWKRDESLGQKVRRLVRRASGGARFDEEAILRAAARGSGAAASGREAPVA